MPASAADRTHALTSPLMSAAPGNSTAGFHWAHSAQLEYHMTQCHHHESCPASCCCDVCAHVRMQEAGRYMRNLDGGVNGPELGCKWAWSRVMAAGWNVCAKTSAGPPSNSPVTKAARGTLRLGWLARGAHPCTISWAAPTSSGLGGNCEADRYWIRYLVLTTLYLKGHWH